MAIDQSRNEALRDPDRQNQDQDSPARYDSYYYHHHGPGLMGLSIDEIKAIRECETEANWKWAMPASLITGAGAYLASNRNLVGSAPAAGGLRSWATVWLVTTCAIMGNLIGRLAYTTFGGCQDKLAALPANSHIGETARKLNAAGLQLPPSLIVSGADGWGGFWPSDRTYNRGYGSGYRWLDQDRPTGFPGPGAPEDSARPTKF